MPIIGFTRNCLGQFRRNTVIDNLTRHFAEEYKSGLSLNKISMKHHISAVAIKQRLQEEGVVVSSSPVFYKPRRLRSDIPTDFIAWLAGFYEGEGSLRTKGSEYDNFQLSISQSDIQVLQNIKARIGTGRIHYGGHGNYQIVISGHKDVLGLLKLLQPHLQIGHRRSTVNRAIRMLEKKLCH